MSLEMSFEKACKLEQRIETELGCHEVIATPIKVESTKKPRPDLESTVSCKEKARVGRDNITCAVLDGSYCPLSLPVSSIIVDVNFD